MAKLEAVVELKENAVGNPLPHDAIITLEDKELAIAVGEYVEREYGVEAVGARISMEREHFGSNIAHATASVRVRKKVK